jgi:hypothetical protein
MGTILAFLCLGALEVALGLGAAASIGDQIRETAKSSQTELENQPKELERIKKDAKE